MMAAHVLTDMRYGLRQLTKTPGFTIVAVLTLAVGIGATTAIFSVINGVVLRPLPFAQPERLVRVLELVPQYGRFAVAPANFLDWRERNRVFERIAAYNGGTETYVGSDGPERIPMAFVSWDTFELLGVRPALGRGFDKREDAPKQNTVAVLSHGMWQRRFGGDPGAVGRTITLSGTPVTIAGVMPAGFYFPTRNVEYWRPIALNPANAPRGAHYIAVIARLKPDVSVVQSGADMRTIAQQLAAQYPDASGGESAEVVEMQELIVGPVRPMLMTLLAAVALVILIACANVANLLLVRASVREKELAIRAALGAGRRRLVVQMICESIVLALAGGACGVVLAYLAIAPIQTLGAGSVPRVAEITIDRAVIAFALAATIATGLLFGLAPAWQAARGNVGAALKDTGRSTVSARSHRLRAALLVGEVALSLVLLVGAALLLRSFSRLTNVDPGFEADRVLSFAVALPATTYPRAQHVTAFFDRLLERLRTLPGVEAAGMVQQIPIRGDYVLSVMIDRRPPVRPSEAPSANYRVVSPGYFKALGIPVRRGRDFTARDDTATAPKVALVDEAFVQRHFPGEEPLGRGLDMGNGTDGYYEIVGVVGNVRHEGLGAAPHPTMYVPYTQDPFSMMTVMVRTSGNPEAFAASARQAVREIDGNLPAFAIAPLTSVITESVAQRRFTMLLIALFALVALFLAAVGLYGVVAYAVSQRTQELGLRMAIGAQRGDVLRMVLGNGMKLALIGVVIGLGGALALAKYTSSMLFEVTPFDPWSYAATAALLLAVAALACYMPARRATTVDPVVALRAE
jgi:putative ABC transport system permease protein